jgi:lipopolysaccharide export system ATP-binding protein
MTFNRTETPITKKPRLKEVPKGLSVQHLSKAYKKRPVLRDISFSIQRGEAVALLGPNGAGKTTCFYITTGLIGADGGYILLDGQDITQLPMYRRARLGIGYLPQESSIFRGLNVEENLRAVIEFQKITKEEQDLLLEDLLAEFGIEHLRPYAGAGTLRR